MNSGHCLDGLASKGLSIHKTLIIIPNDLRLPSVDNNMWPHSIHNYNIVINESQTTA